MSFVGGRLTEGEGDRIFHATEFFCSHGQEFLLSRVEVKLRDTIEFMSRGNHFYFKRTIPAWI